MIDIQAQVTNLAFAAPEVRWLRIETLAVRARTTGQLDAFKQALKKHGYEQPKGEAPPPDDDGSAPIDPDTLLGQ